MASASTNSAGLRALNSAVLSASLKRALSVRQLLIDSGVPSDRIDVRAMGGTTDAGKPDRVDIMLHT